MEVKPENKVVVDLKKSTEKKYVFGAAEQHPEVITQETPRMITDTDMLSSKR